MVNLQASASQILDVWFIKLTFLLIVIFYLTKPEKRVKISNTASILLLWVKVPFLPENVDFLQKQKQNKTNSKIKGVLVLKGILRVYLRTKFQVYSIILTIFIWCNPPPPPPLPLSFPTQLQNEPLKSLF